MNTEKFEAGEIAILACDGNAGPAGAEVEVLGRAFHFLCGDGYHVRGRWAGGDFIWCAPRDLRKKRPPRDDMQLVRWSECPWQPQGVPA